jgi:hypothetical protein
MVKTSGNSTAEYERSTHARARQRGQVERLAMPMPDQKFLLCDECRRQSHAPLDVENEATLPGHLLPPAADAPLAVYRWMLGHHVAICSWRLLADLLETALRKPSRTAEILEEGAFLVDVYSAMLTYAGSCTAETYAQCVRPRMMEVSPSFSGTWARDYEYAQYLEHRLSPDPHGAFGIACRKMAILHMSQAKRLVPGGVSLLKAAGRHAANRASEPERELFDRFFLTERRAGCQWSFHTQLVRRISQIVCDLRMRPLSLVGYDEPAVQPALSCEATLGRLASIVTGATR